MQASVVDSKVVLGAIATAGLALLSHKLFSKKKKCGVKQLYDEAHDFYDPIALEQLQCSYDFIIGK